MNQEQLIRDAVLRVGEVTEVNGQTVQVRVDRNKNVSDLLFDGDVLKNISVNSYVAIRKGFTSLIGKVDGERLDDVTIRSNPSSLQKTDKNRRFLTVSLAGYIDLSGRFKGGLRELPLIGNEVFIVTKSQIQTIHDLAEDGRLTVKFATTDGEGFDIAFPLDGLFNSHIAIFGNTGSGKSNTLASLYGSFVKVLSERNQKAYKENVRVLLLDFNGEYVGKNCITTDKHVYELTTSGPAKDRLPVPNDVLTNLDMISILADATDKTQKPFLRRALNLHANVFGAGDPTKYFRGILKNNAALTLAMSDKQRADNILDYFRAILSQQGEEKDVREGIEWHNKYSYFHKANETSHVYAQQPESIPSTALYQLCDKFNFEDDILSELIVCMYVQLISDVLTNRALNEHIAPVINRLIGRRRDIEKIFDTSATGNFWKKNFIVVSLNGVNLDMKKTLPLLLAKHLYQEHKRFENKKSLTLIVDEAHNILSTESFRESESWKDYRLETFEEIIKEGRKFGVFITISSQRPNDISPTITSQAHNYFIHRLVNQRDLAAVSSAVSYIDKISESSIPTLPTGTCIFSGVAGQMPLKLRIRPLADETRPRSSTIKFEDLTR
jgi:uncharacterized protein